MVLRVVLGVIGTLIIVKCIVLLLFTDFMRRFTLGIARDKKKLRKTAWMYLVIGVILLLIALLTRNA